MLLAPSVGSCSWFEVESPLALECVGPFDPSGSLFPGPSVSIVLPSSSTSSTRSDTNCPDVLRLFGPPTHGLSLRSRTPSNPFPPPRRVLGEARAGEVRAAALLDQDVLRPRLIGGCSALDVSSCSQRRRDHIPEPLLSPRLRRMSPLPPFRPPFPRSCAVWSIDC